MKREVGLWIDQHKTVIVTVENEVAVTREIRSNIEKHTPVSKGPHSTAPKLSAKSLTKIVEGEQPLHPLSGYYEGITSFVRDADSIWIFGPGEAKVGLENHLKSRELGERIVGVDTVNKMTDTQIAAKVQAYFQRF
jgi:hypothetical protein